MHLTKRRRTQYNKTQANIYRLRKKERGKRRRLGERSVGSGGGGRRWGKGRGGKREERRE